MMIYIYSEIFLSYFWKVRIRIVVLLNLVLDDVGDRGFMGFRDGEFLILEIYLGLGIYKICKKTFI